MVNIIRKISAEISYIERTIPDIQSAFDKNNLNSLELRGLAKCIHEIYNGIEKILKQILLCKYVNISDSKSWNKDILTLSVSNSVISENTADLLYEYTTFRHYAAHAYGFRLDEERVFELAKNIIIVWNQYLSEIRKLYPLESNSTITKEKQ